MSWLPEFYYVAITNFPALGIGHVCDPASFDEAVDAYAEKMEYGLETSVLRINPGRGTVFDVTNDAADRVRYRLKKRGQDIPKWLEEE